MVKYPGGSIFRSIFTDFYKKILQNSLMPMKYVFSDVNYGSAVSFTTDFFRT